MAITTDDMKRLIIYTLILTLLSCSNQTDKQIKEKQDLQETNNSGLTSGEWYYSPYVDSTIFNKSIFKYSYTCASFAYQIIYDTNRPDSILFVGYHEQTVLPLIKKEEKMYWAGDKTQHWVLKFNDDFSKLTFKEYMDPTYANKPDPKEYVFTKADKKIKQNLSRHFILGILKGKYINDSLEVELTDRLIKRDDFTDFYELKGLNNLKTYSIAIDFWEMIPQMDLIYFYDNKGNASYYNWTFENADLVLRHVEEIYEDGDFAGGKPTEVAYRLKK